MSGAAAPVQNFWTSASQLEGVQNEAFKQGTSNIIHITGEPYAANVGALPLTGMIPRLSERESAMPDRDDLTDAKIAKSEAQIETKIARMEGAINTAFATITTKIDNLSGQVAEQRRDRNLIIGTIVVAAIALGAMLWGMATYGDALFGRGMSVRDVVNTVIKEQQLKGVQPAPKN